MLGFAPKILICLAAWGSLGLAHADEKQAAPPKAKAALQFTYEGEQDIATFLQKNKCVIGSWELKKATDDGWEGSLHYACFNHKPGGVRYVAGPFKVLKPKGFAPPMNDEFDGFGNHVILRESKREGFHEIVAFVVPIEKVKGKRWLEGVGDLDWAGMYQRKYRYEGMVREAIAALESDAVGDRAKAARVLSTLGEEAADALLKLLKAVKKEEDDTAREAMIRALATVGFSEPDVIIPRLIELVADESKAIKIAAAQAIAFQGANGKAAIDALIKATGDQSKDVKIEAIRALSHMGVGEPRVMRHLNGLANKSDDATVRKHARSAIQKIEADTPVERQVIPSDPQTP